MNSFVIAGPYDSEDGTLFWSNDNGWGFLGTATVFSEAETLGGDIPLPLSDGDEPRWMLLPKT